MVLLGQHGVVLLLVACCMLCTTVVSVPGGQPVELSCSVFVSGDWDYALNETATEEDGRWQSSCTQMVERVRQRCGGKRINFIPTHYWKDPGNGRGDPTATYAPTSYCYKFSTLFNLDGDCREPTPADIEAYVGNMTLCFQRAAELGFDIKVTPHLDDGLMQGGWRNALDFDPQVKYGTWSYDDIMLTPLQKALAAAINETTLVYFSMTGEMSLTVVKYPSSYSLLADKFRAASQTVGPKNMQVGVSFNFNKLYTVQVTAELVRSEAIPTVEFQAMCENLDFLGISSYSRWETGFRFGARQLEYATASFMEEASHLGVDLRELVNDKGKGFHLSEYGIGGGTCGAGDCVANGAVEVSSYPYHGIYGMYKWSEDPWQNPENRRFRAVFYNTTMRWLRRSGGPTVRIDAAFVWTLASWDFAGIHPMSSSVEGTYYDPEVTGMLRQYNDWVVQQPGIADLPEVAPPAIYDAPVPLDNLTVPDPPVAPNPGGTLDGATQPPRRGNTTLVLPPSDQPGPSEVTATNPFEAPTADQAQQGNTSAVKEGSSSGASGSSQKGGLRPNVIIAIATVISVVVFVIIATVIYVTWKMHKKTRPHHKAAKGGDLEPGTPGIVPVTVYPPNGPQGLAGNDPDSSPGLSKGLLSEGASASPSSPPLGPKPGLVDLAVRPPVWSPAAMAGRTADPRVSYTSAPGASYTSDPRASYTSDPRASYISDPRASYISEPRASYTSDPRASYTSEGSYTSETKFSHRHL